ncbi:hypothetical protein ACSC95_29975 [Burkholderia vietnamiensis]
MPRIDATATLSQPTRDASRESLSDRHRIAGAHERRDSNPAAERFSFLSLFACVQARIDSWMNRVALLRYSIIHG